MTLPGDKRPIQRPFSARALQVVPTKVRVNGPYWNKERRRAGADMKRMVLALAVMLGAAAPAMAASIINADGEPRTVVVADGAERTEIEIGAGETAEVCPDGCFVTMPNGDREAVKGDETIEISNGVGRIR